MSGVALRTKIDTRVAENMLAQLSLFDRRALANEVGEILVSSTVQRFRDGVDPDGNPWIPSERALREGGKTLVDRGHLRDSNTYVVDLNGRAISVGTNDIRAGVLYFGGKTGRNHATELPGRQPLGISTEDEDDIQDAVQAHLERALQ